ncbi:MAG: SUMF1/EgtB/PvdO family nonheme iron enzyme [Gemmatimonadota bacterium]
MARPNILLGASAGTRPPRSLSGPASSCPQPRARSQARDDSDVVGPRSNLGSDGPRPVGQNRAMNSLGVYDLAGNVREWCYNEAGGDTRATRGGAWSDAPYHVS